MRLKACSEQIVNRRAEQSFMLTRIAELDAQVDETKTKMAELEQAKDVLNRILMVTQEDITHYIEQTVTNLVAHIFGDQYRFFFEMSLDRGKPSLTPMVEKNGTQVSPKDEMGGGLMDVLALGLRMALWSLDQKALAPVMILDEPGKYLDRPRVPLFGQALKEMSNQLGLQIIMVTHLDEMKELADRSFTVRQERGVSYVEGVCDEELGEDHAGASQDSAGTLDVGRGSRRGAANHEVGSLSSDQDRIDGGAELRRAGRGAGRRTGRRGAEA